MRLDKHLVVSRGGAARIRENAPQLAAGEVAIRLLVDIPDALFERPALEAHISIPEGQAKPIVIEAKILSRFQENLSIAVGRPVALTVVGIEVAGEQETT